MEYMAAGLPVLVSNPTGIEEIVVHGVNGLVHPIGDEERLAEDWSYLLLNEEERCRMGCRGSEMIRLDEFTPKEELRKITGLIETVSRVNCRA
jgi:glycosyltransferase involved in cell wall biosynthesis